MKGMVVWFGIAISMACACSKQAESELSAAKADLARLQLTSLAAEAYPLWRMRNAETACPAALAELLEYTNRKDTVDPWGNELTMVCGDGAPPAAKGFGVSSAGPDGKAGTADDLTSWQ